MTIRIAVQPKSNAQRLSPDSSLAYAAGMFDGDGCIHIARQKKLSARRGHIYRLVMNLAQNHLNTLIDFQNLVGVGGRIYMQKRTGSQNKDTFSLIYSGNAAADVIRRLQPFLLRKQDEAKVALEFQDDCEISRHFGPAGCPDELWERRKTLYQKLRDLK